MSQEQQNYDQDQDLFSTFDFEKFKVTFRKSWILLILFMGITITGAWLYVRYTKPTYESSSVIKLNFESEASMLNISSPVKDQGEISGEIELLKSRLFFGKVVDAIDMDVSYFRSGRVLDGERFGTSPIAVSYKIKNDNYYNRKINVDLIDKEKFQLRFGGYSKTHRFGEDMTFPEFNLRVDKTSHFRGNASGEYYFIVNTKEALISFLKKNVNVVPESFTAKTLKVSIQTHDQKKSQLLVRTIDSIYEIYTKEAKNQALEQKISFLDERLEATEKILHDYEDYFEKFTINHRTTNLGGDLSRTITELSSLDTIHFELRAKKIDVDLLKKQLEADQPLILNQIFVDRFPSSVTTLLKEYQGLLGERTIKKNSYSESTFIVQQLNQQLELVRSQLLALVDSYGDDVSNQLERVVSRKSSLENSLNQLPSLETEYSKNRRFYAQQEEFMLTLRKAKMDIEITKAGTVTDIVVLSPASFPNTSITPQKLLIYGLGVMAGLMISVVFLLLRYLVNNKITSTNELERLINVPIVGSVPFFKQEKNSSASLVIKKDSKSSLSESLRTIRTNMEFMNGTSDKHIISVSSTVSGEGKTFIGVNLGGIIALSGQRVCLVDIDMRKPKVHLAFENNDNSKGVSTVLSGKSKTMESILPTNIESFSYMPAGPVPPNPSELLLGEHFDKMIAELKKEFDVIILDTPPVGLVTDGILVMKKADLQLYVVRSAYSKRSYMKTIENLKKTNQFNQLTVIFNSLRGSGSYGYGYGYGHGYYEEEPQKRGFLSSIKSFF